MPVEPSVLDIILIPTMSETFFTDSLFSLPAEFAGRKLIKKIITENGGEVVKLNKVDQRSKSSTIIHLGIPGAPNVYSASRTSKLLSIHFSI